MKVGIVGHAADKFTEETEKIAKATINDIIGVAASLNYGDNLVGSFSNTYVISGRCPLGGVDIWAVDVARSIFVPEQNIIEFPPVHKSWERGYKPRNIRIAYNSDEVHCIVVATLPDTYKKQAFDGPCYHCLKRMPKAAEQEGWRPHMKSGGCWTTWYAIEKFNKKGVWHVI